MKNEFIPYEQALALKELGFNEPCFGRYYYKESWPILNPNSGETELTFEFGQYIRQTKVTTLVPLYQQAFGFFREKYGLMHIIYPYDFTCEIDFLNDRIYDPINGDFIPHNHIVDNEGETLKHNSYKEAELTCLKELIEIVKSKYAK